MQNGAPLPGQAADPGHQDLTPHAQRWRHGVKQALHQVASACKRRSSHQVGAGCRAC